MARDLLDAALQARLSETQAAWLARALARGASGTQSELLQMYTEASRQLGDSPLLTEPSADDTPLAACRHWSLEDAGRLLLLLARHHTLGDLTRASADAAACYEQGDAREQRSWLRAVASLPEPERYVGLAIDACRTNILPLFEAIACENPYPARHFPDRNFNQMVLKAMFNGVALARIHGLPARANRDLARMATDYAAERRAAGRSIPPDLALATAGATAAGPSR